MSRILVTRSSMPEYEEYIEEIKDIWDSHWLTNMGAKHNELEKELEKYLKVDHVSLFSNGHMALEASDPGTASDGGSHYHAVYVCVHNTCDRAERADAGIL